MSDLKSMSMSELIALYNEQAAAKGIAQVTEFKNLAAARSAINKLEGKTMNKDTTPTEGKDKYNSTSKRGPNQGIGAFAKAALIDGKTTAEVLAMVKETFPDAKTTMACIAYYKAALKNPNLGKKAKVAKVAKTAEELRAEAQALLAAADTAEALAAAAAQPQPEPAPV